MIRRLGPDDTALLDALPPRSEAAVRLRGLAHAYGTQTPIVQFWQDEAGGFASLMDGCAVVDLPESAPSAEWRQFLTLLPGLHSLRTDAATAGALAQAGWTGWQTGLVMTPGPSLPPPARKPRLLSPREAWPVLSACFGQDLPPFDAWYVDMSHRLRHDAALLVGFVEAGRAVACAMTVAQSPGGALIGGVATLPACRGKGYASACVLTLAQALTARGDRVLLSPKNEEARELYARLGFVKAGQWGSVRRALTF